MGVHLCLHDHARRFLVATTNIARFIGKSPQFCEWTIHPSHRHWFTREMRHAHTFLLPASHMTVIVNALSTHVTRHRQPARRSGA